jgi:hypothetical protein
MLSKVIRRIDNVKTRWRKKKNYEGHCALVDCLIGIVKRMWLLSYGWPRCTLDGQFFPSDTTFIYVYRHRIINVVFIFVVVSQCSLAMVSKLSCYNVFFRFISMWLCNHMNVFTYIHICEKRVCVCVSKSVLFQSSLRTNVFWPAGHYLRQ